MGNQEHKWIVSNGHHIFYYFQPITFSILPFLLLKPPGMGILSRKPKAIEASEGISPNPSDIEQGESKPPEIHAETLSPASTFAQKWKLSSKASDGDTALALFDNPDDLHEAISPADQRALQWKIDFMILPYLAVCYAFFYIDKTTLSYAAIFGIKDDLHLQGTEYSWLSSIFYFGFLAWACESLTACEH